MFEFNYCLNVSDTISCLLENVSVFILGVLSVMNEELAEQPLYYVLDNLCNVIHSTTPSHAQFRSALLHAGYRVSSTHCHEAGIKTNATADGK